MAEEVLTPRANVNSKQQLLDLTDKVSQEAKAQRDAEEESRPASAESEIGRDWVLGTIMLGAAAEELTADVKRSLAADLLKLAALMADDWTRACSTVDYAEIKKQLFDEIIARGHISEEGKARRLLDMAVDFVEIQEVSIPLYSIMHILSESARNRVLMQSIKTIRPSEAVEELLMALWMYEMSFAEGEKALAKVLKMLPDHPFLRVTIANYLLSRAFWYKSNSSARAHYVEGARAALKPLDVSVNPQTLEKKLDGPG